MNALVRRDDVAVERRLEREVLTRLGVLYAGCASKHDASDVARVEVTYGYETDEGLDEHAGHFIVYVGPQPSPESVEERGGDPLDVHPATVATDRVHAHVGAREYDYFSVDDVFAV